MNLSADILFFKVLTGKALGTDIALWRDILQNGIYHLNYRLKLGDWSQLKINLRFKNLRLTDIAAKRSLYCLSDKESIKPHCIIYPGMERLGGYKLPPIQA